MADFNTHLSFAAIGSGLAASTLFHFECFNASQCLLLWLLGSIGGILPDVDSDASYALKGVFSLLGGLLAGAVVCFIPTATALIYVWSAALFGFALVRVGLMKTFAKFTVHRGVFHSVVAGCAMAMCVVVLLAWVASDLKALAWFGGGFVLFGFLLHLVLDEIYAVDISGMELKRSFGSALKIMDSKNKVGSLTLILISLLLFVFSPDTQPPARKLSHLVDSLHWSNTLGPLCQLHDRLSGVCGNS